MTHTAGHTIHGNGQINGTWDSGYLVNHGLIMADTPGKVLYLMDGGPSASTNDGTLKAVNGGTLQVRARLDNTGGRILADGGDVQLHGARISGGTLAASGTSRFQIINNSAPSLANLTIGAGTLVQNVNGDFFIGGTIVNNGNIVLDSPALATNTGVKYWDGAVLAGTGSLQMRYGGPGTSVRLDSDTGGFLTNGPLHTIRGSGNILGSFQGGTIINHGAIIADSPDYPLYLRGSAVTNDGRLAAATGGNLWIGVGVTNTNGTILADGGDVRVGGVWIGGGTLSSTGASSIRLLNGAGLSGVRLASGANVQLPAGNNANINGDVANDGTLSLAGEMRFGTTTFSGSGTIEIAGASLNAEGNPVVTLGANQVLRGTGSFGAAFNGHVVLDNQGTIEASGGHIGFGVPPVQFSGATLTGGAWIARANSSIAVGGNNITTKRFPQAKTYDDWRKAVDHKALDAVMVSTTDHTHALASVWAMRRGLSVYCEKPIAHSVHEARVVRETYLANKDKIATQQGTQIHATDNYRRVVEWVQAGAIGPVREAHVWCDRVGPCPERPKDTPPVPAYLNWDLWLGPAPERPFHSSYMGGCMAWEQRWDFGNGCLGDMGSHLIDLPFWALKLGHPLTAEAEGDVKSEESYPHWLKCDCSRRSWPSRTCRNATAAGQRNVF
jgi:hypothetical protein